MTAHRYRRILAISDARLPMVATAIDRIPIASLSLATILLIHAETGSFKTAGIVEAAFAIATAISLPVQGRLVDRLGQSEVLGIAVALNPITLIGLVIAAHDGASTGVLASIAALCGATTPATGSCMRALWARLVPDAGLRQSAFALDAISLEVAFIVGPLVTGLLVTVASPTVAVLFNAALATIGTALFVASRASRAWSGGGGPRHWAGPLRSRGIVLIVLVELSFGVSLGAMEISITAFATGEGAAGLAGVLIAAQAAASFAAGAWYGSRHHAAPAASRYVRLNFLLALGLVPLLFTTSIVEAVPLMALSGLALAPATAALYSLVDELAPAGTATEAFTWMITSIAAGVAGGQAMGGVLVNGGHPHRGFAATAVAAGIGAAIAFAARPSFQSAPSAA
jgi:MFS family permease